MGPTNWWFPSQLWPEMTHMGRSTMTNKRVSFWSKRTHLVVLAWSDLRGLKEDWGYWQLTKLGCSYITICKHDLGTNQRDKWLLFIFGSSLVDYLDKPSGIKISIEGLEILVLKFIMTGEIFLPYWELHFCYLFEFQVFDTEHVWSSFCVLVDIKSD